jgi:hypothetical protein
MWIAWKPRGGSLECRTRSEGFENDGFAMETERDPVENAVVGESGEPLFCTSLAMRSVSSCDHVEEGALGYNGWSGKAEDESGCKYRQCTASQRRQNFHWLTKWMKRVWVLSEQYA